MVWCGVRYVIWSGADWSGVVSITLYGLVQTGLLWCLLHYMVWCGLVWWHLLRIWSGVEWSGTVCYGLWFGTTWSGAKLLWFIPVWSAMVKTRGHMVTVVV